MTATLDTGNRLKPAIALMLTTVAGFVDVVGYISVYHIFTAHMTGTTVHLGSDIIHGEWHAVAIAAVVVLAFFLGSVAGRLLIEIGARTGVRRVASIAFSVEVLLVAWFMLTARPESRTLLAPTFFAGKELALLGGAMGVQTATLTRIGPLTVHTTFVTGMLNKLAQLVFRLLMWTYVLHRTKLPSHQLLASRSRTSQKARFVFGIWALYLGGAVAGTWLDMNWGLNCLLVPIALLLISISADQIRPLSLEEESDAAEQQSSKLFG